MKDTFLIWCVPIAVALHNLEEAIWLPDWSRRTGGRWRRPVGTRPFRFAVLVLTLVVFLVAAWAHIGGAGSLGQYVLASYALGQGLNVLFPHLVVTIATRTYAPGLLTGILLVLPSATAYLVHSFAGGELEAGRFFLVTAVFVPLMLLSIPVLFRIGIVIAGRSDSSSITSA